MSVDDVRRTIESLLASLTEDPSHVSEHLRAVNAELVRAYKAGEIGFDEMKMLRHEWHAELTARLPSIDFVFRSVSASGSASVTDVTEEDGESD